MSPGLLVATLLLGAPVPVPEVTNAEQVRLHLGQVVAIFGVVERVAIGKGQGAWQGTAVVLDDDTTVYVSYAAPPAGWDVFVGSRVRVEGLLSPSLTDHEQSLLAPHLRAPGTPKLDVRVPGKLVGRRVRLGGLARDAKGGAVLLVGAVPISLAGLEAWPNTVNGQRVVVGGTLVSKQYLPEATRDAKGAWSQGAQGSQLVLEAPRWRLVKEPKP